MKILQLMYKLFKNARFFPNAYITYRILLTVHVTVVST